MTQEIAIGSRGMLRPTTFGEAMEFAKMIAGSGMVPAAYRGKPADVLIAIQMGAELGFAPMQALRGIAVINGQPSVYGDAALALVRGSGLCESLVEHIEGDGDDVVAVCVAKRRGQEEPIIGRFSIADAKRAQLLGKPGPWQQYRNRMLAMRARGFVLRDGFADVLRGVITAEEAQDYPRQEPVDITPQSTASDLDAFARKGESVNAETGEVRDILAEAYAAARGGRKAWKPFYDALTDEQYQEIHQDLPSLKKNVLAADAKHADTNADDTRNLTLAEQKVTDKALRRSHPPIDPPQNKDALGPSPEPVSEPDDGLRPTFVVDRIMAGRNLDIKATADALVAMVGKWVRTQADRNTFAVVNRDVMGQLKITDPEQHFRVLEAIAEDRE